MDWQKTEGNTPKCTVIIMTYTDMEDKIEYKAFASLVTHGWSRTIQSSYTSQFIKKPPQFHIGSVIDLYLIVWTDYAGYNIPVDIAFIIENPWAIATSSSHIIILICKKIFFFKITTVIWLAVEKWVGTNQNVSND